MNPKIPAIAAVILVAFGLYYRMNPLVPKVMIGSHAYRVELALMEPQKTKGLGGRDRLDKDAGMLFPYDHAEQFEFWMRGMRFPLDFVWIRERRVIDLTENVQPPVPGQKPVIVKPAAPADTVLEISAGEASRAGIRIGDTVRFIDR